MTRFSKILVCFLMFHSTSLLAEPVGTSFTYQGELKQQNAPATGIYDFRFELFDAQTDGASVSSNIQLEDVSVQDGVFAVELDFGSEPFDGTQLWLGIAVREGTSASAHTTLNPRQKLTASPYSVSAQSSTGGNCTAITYLPYVINTEGVYCLMGNLSTSDPTVRAINIYASNVTIDLNGWRLDGRGAGTTDQSRGISCWQRNNITVRNGTIIGFEYGIAFFGSAPYTGYGGHLIEDVRIEQSSRVGLAVYGEGSIVRRNYVLNTGNIVAEIYGITITGPGSKVIDNDIHEITTTGSAIGISAEGADSAVIENNRIGDVKVDFELNSKGITVGSSSGVFVRNNSIANAGRGIIFSSNSTGKYRDNLTSNVATPYTGGTDAGGNN